MRVRTAARLGLLLVAIGVVGLVLTHLAGAGLALRSRAGTFGPRAAGRTPYYRAPVAPGPGV